ncbi:hypothetical protein [Pseudoxanthomonas sp. GW2]|jgi:hypothetical protein|uniref:hypothetical protein n=1 Tax=Pseudoxanthomonas sp. GW2 TaxID=1211114 RepID=UPI00031FF346|nr:hypothetical protein [Pseudoxanthomonas sp. GW2]
MPASLAALLHDLTSLRQALDRGDYGAADAVLAGHETRLRELIESLGPQAPLQTLRGLLQLQHLMLSDDGPLTGGSA